MRERESENGREISAKLHFYRLCKNQVSCLLCLIFAITDLSRFLSIKPAEKEREKPREKQVTYQPE